MSILHQFRGPHGGFGLTSYQRARAAGINPIHIANAIGSSGMSLGWRARDAIIADSAQQAFALKGQRNEARDTASEYKQTIDDLNNRIADFDSKLGEYRTQVDDLTTKYTGALKTADENAAARDEFESKFRQASTDFDAARAEADRYREEAVGQQLRAVRSGSTVGGANQAQNLTGGLASGRTGYSSDEGDIGDLAESMRGQGGLTDSVLSREGPVVQQLSRGSRGGGRSSSSAANTNAGTGSYYASRFR